MGWQFYVVDGAVVGRSELGGAIIDKTAHFVTDDPKIGAADMATLSPEIAKNGEIINISIIPGKGAVKHPAIAGVETAK